MVGFKNFEGKMANKKKLVCSFLFFALVLVFSFYLFRPAFLGQLGGTFKSKEVPREYLVLKDFFYQQKEKFSILWVPYRQRFGFWSESHPALSANEWIEDNKCLEPFCSLKIVGYNREYFNCHPNEKCFPADASFLANPNVLPVLTEMKVRYIIVPLDSEGEIFLYERQYDPEHRRKLEEFLDTISWLKKIPVAEKIAVYEIK